MELELTWTYDERRDALSVEFPTPDFDTEIAMVLKLSWETCHFYFQFHDFFGRRPRTRYLSEGDVLMISFPPYDLMEDGVVREEQGEIKTCLDQNTGVVKAVHITDASKTLLWSPIPKSNAVALIRRHTY